VDSAHWLRRVANRNPRLSERPRPAEGRGRVLRGPANGARRTAECTRQTRRRSRATPGIPNPHAITIAPHRARPRSTHQRPANCDGLQVPANKPTSATNRSGQPQPSADGQPHPNPRADHQTQPPNPSDYLTQPPAPGEPPSPAPHPSEPTSPATAPERTNKPSHSTRANCRTQPQEPSEPPDLTTGSRAQRRRKGGAGGGAPAARQAKRSRTNDEGEPPCAFRRHSSPLAFVDDTGIEPVTSSVSGKRATAAPIVRRKHSIVA
jgi:hypothetical protein